MSEILPCVEIEPSQPIRGSIVWLHGLGASGHDFEDIVPMLQRPDVRFVFPHAPQRAVTINMGLIMPAWYDIERLDAEGHANPSHVRESCALVTALLDREVERGVPSERTVLAGFSQGGAIALQLGTRHPQTLRGVLVLSAYELFPDARPAEQSPANAATAMLFCHGTYDPLVAVERGRASYEAYASEGRPVAWHEYAIAHAMCLEEVSDIRDWLAGLFDPLSALDR
jgi:phospholipase/carboxylesterase